jgi:hypothetical protein
MANAENPISSTAEVDADEAAETATETNVPRTR